MLKLTNVNHIYNQGTAMEAYALRDVTLEIRKGEFVGIIGRTGSGKSTLIQHFDGLLKPTTGTITFEGEDIYRKGFSLKELRRRVGLVFQYPEHQLFETDVLRDVMFGPKNIGISTEESRERALEALRLVGVPEDRYEASPFELSGGQKRRVAIAGVLAMKPDILVLDEPTAGLDPCGRDEILDEIKKLKDETGMGVVLVSHSMDDVANYVDRIVVVNEGTIAFDDEPRKVFAHYKELETMGLAAPQMTYVVEALRNRGIELPAGLITVDEVRDELLKILKK